MLGGNLFISKICVISKICIDSLRKHIGLNIWYVGFLHRNASIDSWRVSHVSGSESVPSGSRFKRSGGACLSLSYTGDWLFSKLGHLAILSDSIEPWPMAVLRCWPRGYANSCKMAGICGRMHYSSFDLHFKTPSLLPLPSMPIFFAWIASRTYANVARKLYWWRSLE